MKDNKTRLKEMLAVLTIMSFIPDKDDPISHQFYVKGIKDMYNLDIDRRRVSQILNDLYEITNENPAFLPYFKIKECERGKGKFYMEKGDPEIIAKMIRGIDTSRALTSHERGEIIDFIRDFFIVTETKESENMTTNNRDFEIGIRDKFEQIKEQCNEIDFSFRLIEGLNERVLFYPNFAFQDLSYFEKTTFKGFVYSILTIDEIDYAVIMTASDSINNPHTVFLAPCLLLNIKKIYKKEEGVSKGPDFSLKIDKNKKQKFQTIDEWIKSILQTYSRRIDFNLKYKNEFEKAFFMSKVLDYFEFRDDISFFDNKADSKICVERVHSTYQGFLKFLFSNPLIYKNIEIIDPFLREQIQKDFGDIINNFYTNSKFIMLGQHGFRF